MIDKRISRRLFKYFTPKAIIGEGMNQFYRLAKSMKSFNVYGVVIEPTNTCNFKCEHCTARLSNEPKGFMDILFYKKILKDNPQLTCIIFGRNGEPTLHPKFCDMLFEASRKGIYTVLYTNGSRLNNIGDIIRCGLKEINISLEGVKAAYEYNRHYSYKQIKHTIEYLSSLAIDVGINCAMDSIEVIKEWNGKVHHIDIEPLMGKLSRLRKSPCRTLWRNAVIRWDGEVFPCCVDIEGTMSLGNVRDENLINILNNDKAIRLKTRHLKKDFPYLCKYCDGYFG